MMFALRSREAVREGRNQLFVDRNIFPQTLDVLLTRSEPFGIELIVDEYDEYSFTGKEFGAIVQYPAANGAVRDYADFTAAAHAKGALVTAVADLLALALLKAPGEWGADIAVGSTQRLGTPMGFGGPERRLHGHARGLQAQHAGPHHRRLGGPSRQQGAAHGAPDARTAHQARARHVEHLHRLGADGLDGGLLLRLQRPRGAEARRRHGPPGRRNGRRRTRRRWTTNSPPRTIFDTLEVVGRSRRRAVAGARKRHQLLLPDRRLRAHVVRRGHDSGGGRRGHPHLRRRQRQESQGRKARHRKQRPGRSAPPFGLPDRTGLQRLPLGKRPDALHQTAGTARHIAGQLDDLFRFVHHEAQRRGAHAAPFAGRLPEHAPLRPGGSGRGLHAVDHGVGKRPGDDHGLRGLARCSPIRARRASTPG